MVGLVLRTGSSEAQASDADTRTANRKANVDGQVEAAVVLAKGLPESERRYTTLETTQGK